MKMYFFVKNNIPNGKAITSVAHGSLIAHLAWQQDPEYLAWLMTSFKKVVCTCSDFDELKKHKHIIVTESTLNKQETVLVMFPTNSKIFKKYSLWENSDIDTATSHKNKFGDSESPYRPLKIKR